MKHLSKMLKGLVAVFAAAAMALTLAPTAFAAETTPTTYKLTLNNTTTGHTYEAYQIFTGDLSTNTKGEKSEKVLSNVKWGTGVTYTGTESAAEVAEKLAAGTMTIAQLEDNLTLTTPVKTVESVKGDTVINDLAAGYYLVKDKDGSQKDTSDAYTKFIVQVVGDTEADIKSDVPTVEKKVKDTNDTTGETSGWQDSADADINDDVQYQITGTMPNNIADYTTYKYIFTDTMSKGLTYTAKNAKITIGDTDVTKYFTEHVGEKNADGGTTVTWTCDNLKGIKGVTLTADTKVVVTYSAQLNKDAVIGAAGNPNTVNLTYSNNPNKGGEGETGKTPDDKNIVFTYKTVVNKVDQEGNSLKGAAFKLEKKQSDGTYTLVNSFTAGDATTFTFTGLDDGDYKLTETTTPAGYNTIDPIEFTISATHDEASDNPTLLTLTGDKTSGEAKFAADKDAGSLTTDVVNKKGSTLPSTGGMGTTVLYVAGAAIVVAAGIGLAIRRNKRQDA
ncbi:MAG: isopeptide-forming domain-containing fimbrial protein [Olsenella sp.]|jgi:fimbrial isopeptide formation D2 family protein/LPXTG-motif cell wall-anchored protein|nr:isopeptide-forming domain-containing fimbrial protein [Olsenella sp.]